MARFPCNLLIERDLRPRPVAIGRWRNMARQARGYRDGGAPPPQATPALPRPFVERWPPAGEGGFRVQGVPIRGCPCALYPLWGPLPPPTGHLRPLTDCLASPPPPTGAPPPFGAPYPHLLDGPPLAKGGLATYGLRGAGFFRTYPHYPFGVGGVGKKFPLPPPKWV